MHANIYEGLSVSKLTCDLWKGMGIDLLIEDKLLEKHFSEAEHFVDLITLCLQPSELGNQKGKLKTIVTRTVTELHQAAVKFKVGSSSHLLNIRFKYGTLEIPKLTLDDATEALLRNLQDFQGLNCESNYVNDYIAIMNYLVNGPKDAELLVQNGIIENWLSSSEDVSTLFLNLKRETNIDDYNFTYAGLIDDLKAYCKSPWHKWKATLKHNYFNTPRASISVIAAVVLLLLTFIQTVFSIIK
ncbi:hypothetical protein Pint_31162 [Pistacia integerrima]|uniref:Uncharacterized protein n=1 Tax=Pistacia integerrima TaxID=434235 RepID=A0ACC0XLV7_9ROSI|nr:hypothetical protein Pint_31162 [Pistacia integerrima]